MKKPAKTDQTYKVGITISVYSDGRMALFSNGLRQNVLFLYKLFAADPFCTDVFLISHKTTGKDIVGDTFGIPKDHIVQLSAVADEIDHLIVLGGAVVLDELRAFKAKGKQTILYKGGNGAVLSMEAVTVRPPDAKAETYEDYDCYDQVWVTSQHMHTYASYCRTVYRCPVHEIPQIWDPMLGNVLKLDESIKFGFAPPKPEWRVGVIDPNNTVMKTSHYPMLVAEAAYRIRPEVVGHLIVANTIQYAEQDHFRRFANLLTLQKDKRLSVEHRYISWPFIAQYCDAIVTHHWENGLNYSYYEVLSGGYPLIHNSEFLKDVGYYYPQFEPEAGGEVLIKAHESHAENLGSYNASVRKLFARLDPTAEHNIVLHRNLLLGIE